MGINPSIFSFGVLSLDNDEWQLLLSGEDDVVTSFPLCTIWKERLETVHRDDEYFYFI